MAGPKRTLEREEEVAEAVDSLLSSFGLVEDSGHAEGDAKPPPAPKKVVERASDGFEAPRPTKKQR